MQATKKPHNYHKTVVWQKDDRIRKSPLKFYVYYYNELSGDCQASIFTELWRLSVAFCVTLWHMSICAGVIVAVTFQQVDCSPDAKTGTQCHNESLQYVNCAVEKCHKFVLLVLPVSEMSCTDKRASCNENVDTKSPPWAACAPAARRGHSISRSLMDYLTGICNYLFSIYYFELSFQFLCTLSLPIKIELAFISV